jgi:hypothetical protein
MLLGGRPSPAAHQGITLEARMAAKPCVRSAGGSRSVTGRIQVGFTARIYVGSIFFAKRQRTLYCSAQSHGKAEAEGKR